MACAKSQGEVILTARQSWVKYLKTWRLANTPADPPSRRSLSHHQDVRRRRSNLGVRNLRSREDRRHTCLDRSPQLVLKQSVQWPRIISDTVAVDDPCSDRRPLIAQPTYKSSIVALSAIWAFQLHATQNERGVQPRPGNSTTRSTGSSSFQLGRSGQGPPGGPTEPNLPMTGHGRRLGDQT
jgi:hypothetical protein